VFAQPMDVSSADSASFTLKSAAGVVIPSAIAYDGPTRTATLTPSIALSSLTTYTLTIDGQVKAVTGLRMGAPYSWSFKTR
jgi:hypothetical protein